MEVELLAGDCERVCVEIGEVCGRLQLDLPVVRFLHVVYTSTDVLYPLYYPVCISCLYIQRVLSLSVSLLFFYLCYLIKGLC